MDFGKHKFDEAQRAKESKRKAVHVGIKEMKYRPKIGPGDFDTKTRQVAKFLDEGHKVKITIMFRGREVFHPELGKKILDRIAEQMDGMGKPEAVPRLDGRNMVMVLAPEKRAKQSAAAKSASSKGADASRQPARGMTEAADTAVPSPPPVAGAPDAPTGADEVPAAVETSPGVVAQTTAAVGNLPPRGDDPTRGIRPCQR